MRTIFNFLEDPPVDFLAVFGLLLTIVRSDQRRDQIRGGKKKGGGERGEIGLRWDPLVVSTLCVKSVGAMTTPDIYFMGTLVGKYLSVNLCIGPQRPLGIFPGYLGDPPDGG
jgi:hypothetical protein